MEVNKIELVNSMSYALDFLEVGLHQNITNHNRRVTVISLNIGKKLGLSDNELVDLYSYSMFHDNGITYKIYSNIKENGSTIENLSNHCEVGEENLRLFPFIQKRENIILYHHECEDGSGFFGKKGEEIPLFSKIIHLSDMTEVWYRQTNSKRETLEYIKENRGKTFSKKLCDILFDLGRHTAFWLSLDDVFVKEELLRLVPPNSYNMNMDNFLNVAHMLSNIIDAKSPFTFSHSEGLAEKASAMAVFYGYDPLKHTKFVIAAYLHDIGKLVIPNEIIDKPGKLDEREFDIIKSHTFYTRKILEGIKGLEDICEWASNHHEKLNGMGYPYGMSAESLSLECQLMTCLDIYQALTEKRPYRTPATKNEVMRIFSRMINSGEINGKLARDVLEVLARKENCSSGIMNRAG
ncbi:MAG: HD domain-containing phosphohydrolase [Oscillospiraceae bacterium]